MTKKKMTKKTGLGRFVGPGAARRLSERMFDGIPVVDATAQVMLFPNEADAEAARGHQGDFGECVLAQCAARMIGCTRAAFLRANAYLDLPDADGNRVLTHFVLNTACRGRIARFDRFGEFHPAGLVLDPPPPSKTLNARRDYERARMANPKKRTKKQAQARAAAARRRAVIVGDALESNVVRVADVVVRNGTGMVHFRPRGKPGYRARVGNRIDDPTPTVSR